MNLILISERNLPTSDILLDEAFLESERFFGCFVRGIITRKILDNMTIGGVIQKFSGYRHAIRRKFRDIILYGVNRRKVSAFCPV